MDEDLKRELEILSEEIIAVNKRIDTLKKVIGDYLELSSNLSIAGVKVNLKNI